MYRAVQRTVRSCRDKTRLAVFSVPFPQPSFQTCFFLALMRRTWGAHGRTPGVRQGQKKKFKITLVSPSYLIEKLAFFY